MSYDNEDRLSAALQDIVGDRPYTPDVDQIESRGRKMKTRRLALGAGGATFAVAALAAVAVAATGGGAQAPAANLAAPQPATSTAADAPVVKLVGYLSTAPQPTGDATFILRDQVFPGQKIDVYDLIGDDGKLYFGTTRDALVKAVAGGHQAPGSSKEQTAFDKKGVDAAKLAATGDLNEARKLMGGDPTDGKLPPRPLLSPGAKESFSPEDLAKIAKKDKATGQKTDVDNIPNYTDNAVWNNSTDALKYGAGDPKVRAGVIKLVTQIPSVKVAPGTYQGASVLTLTAGQGVTVDGEESLVINADNGLPIKFTADGVTINYGVQRVTVADVAKGNF
ncbi:hypothetical protein HH310_12990 [Actinoplanes sp. TBRC 11911]|uniref:hypothetical protein n=1 Tax=Actinoplanes sp. TBRC 11911 TaxID=2729386 RepID=UPI00145DA281|nr:hypothetical protein [Actinoplanes sp. TBRC 11911]NMO52109.1 hypothetical protein [Actinoplanes sp. TBRC 11911]